MDMMNPIPATVCTCGHHGSKPQLHDRTCMYAIMNGLYILHSLLYANTSTRHRVFITHVKVLSILTYRMIHPDYILGLVTILKYRFIQCTRIDSLITYMTNLMERGDMILECLTVFNEFTNFNLEYDPDLHVHHGITV